MMDSFEFNKIAAAVLAAALVAFGGSTLIEVAQSSHDSHGKPGYVLPVAASTGGAAGGAAAPKAFGFDDIKPLLAKASADAGKAAFKKCAACHTPGKGGKNGTGPNLWGVVGAKRGVHDGFAYSASLKEKAGDWTFESLANFLHNPKGYISGTKMAFGGIKDNAELADMLAYLRSLADTPAPLPQ